MVQFALYKEMRERFKDHLWLDVVSKCDLLRLPESVIETDDELDSYKIFGPTGSIRVSVKSDIGLKEVSKLKCISSSLSISLSLSLSFYLTISLSLYLSISLYIYLFIYLSLSLSLSMYQSTYSGF